MTPEREQALKLVDTILSLDYMNSHTFIPWREIVHIAREFHTSEAEKDRMRQALEKALPAMESACYELLPGPPQMGDQFIRQDDMNTRIELVRVSLAGTPPQPCTACADKDASIATALQAESDLGAKLTALHMEDSRKYRALLVEKQGEIDRLRKALEQAKGR